MTSFSVTHWRYALSAIALLNIAAWSALAAAVKRQQARMSAERYIDCRRQLLLSGAYVFGCAFRSALPVYDIGRIGLFDSWLSSVIVGRSVATIAELSFVAQWALMLRHLAPATRISGIKSISHLIVPLIAIAELCYWYAVLTTSNMGQVFEAILWGCAAALAFAATWRARTRYSGAQRRMIAAWCAVGASYVAFMFLYDLPMYWSRWRADEAHGRHYLSLAQGLVDIVHRRVVSYNWQDWKGEMVWMSLYFTIGVWLSLSLLCASVRQAKRLPALLDVHQAATSVAS